MANDRRSTFRDYSYLVGKIWQKLKFRLLFHFSLGLGESEWLLSGRAWREARVFVEMLDPCFKDHAFPLGQGWQCYTNIKMYHFWMGLEYFHTRGWFDVFHVDQYTRNRDPSGKPKGIFHNFSLFVVTAWGVRVFVRAPASCLVVACAIWFIPWVFRQKLLCQWPYFFQVHRVIWNVTRSVGSAWKCYISQSFDAFGDSSWFCGGSYPVWIELKNPLKTYLMIKVNVWPKWVGQSCRSLGTREGNDSRRVRPPNWSKAEANMDIGMSENLRPPKS